MFRRHGRWERIEQRLQSRVVEPFGQRPGQPRPASPGHVAMDRSLAQPQALRHGPLRQPLTEPQPQHLAYLPHRQSLARHLDPLLLGKGSTLPVVEDCQQTNRTPLLPA